MNQPNFLYLTWLIQIITESLPISSSSHCKLISKFLNPKLKFTQEFEHALHLPTLFVLIAFLINSSLVLISKQILTSSYFFKICFYVFVADIITILFYYFFKFFKFVIPLFLGLLITSLSLFSIYFFGSGNLSEIVLIHAIFMGIAQSVALLPGISRLALTIWIGCFFCLDPLISVTFSCAIQLPLIFAAVFKLLATNSSIYNLFKLNFTKISILILASIVAYNFLWLIINLLQNNLLWIFGLYMLIAISLSIFESVGK